MATIIKIQKMQLYGFVKCPDQPDTYGSCTSAFILERIKTMTNGLLRCTNLKQALYRRGTLHGCEKEKC